MIDKWTIKGRIILETDKKKIAPRLWLEKKKPQKLTLTTFLTHPYIHSSNDESQAASTSSIIARKKNRKMLFKLIFFVPNKPYFIMPANY